MFLNLSPPDGGTVFDMCPPGTMMVDEVCLGAGGPEQFAERDAAAKAKADAKTLAQQNTGISPLLILAAAAAFFIGS